MTIKAKLFFFMLLLAGTSSAQTFKSEAENVQFEFLIVKNDMNASGGKYLEMLDTGYVRWNADLQDSGWYQLTLGYRAFGGDKEEYIIINGKKSAIGLGYSTEWNTFNKNLPLLRGNNVIEFIPGWGNIDIDYISISKVDITPSLKPMNNNYYTKYPRKLFYKIDQNGHEINSVLCDGQEISFSSFEYPYQTEALSLVIDESELEKLQTGSHKLEFRFKDAITLTSNLTVTEVPRNYKLKIITPYVEHGSAMLIILPTGKNMLIDCAKAWVRDSILIPFLYENNIEQIDYFILTHYHDDHASGDNGDKIKKLFNVQKFYDYKSVSTGDVLNIEGVEFKVLNSYKDGTDENTSSLSLKLSYQNFVMIHGGDTYAVNQTKIMKEFPNDIRADVFYANHHFHGSIDVEYIRDMNPSIILLQAQEAIYARDAYSNKFKIGVEKYLIVNSDKYIEDLPTLEIGTVVVRVNSSKDWTYEVFGGLINRIPLLTNDVN